MANSKNKKSKKPSSDAVKRVVKEGAVLVGTFCAGLVVSTVLKGAMPEPKNTAIKIAQFIGVCTLCGVVEDTVEDHIRNDLDEFIDSVEEVKNTVG